MPLLADIFLLMAAVWIVFTDFFYRRISNQLLLILLLVWLAVQLGDLVLLPAEMRLPLLEQTALTVVGALLVLALGFGLFLLRRMGAGDVKCIAVICLWIGFEQQLIFLTLMSLYGGALALALPLFTLVERYCAQPLLYLADRFPRWVIAPTTLDDNRPQGIPYGLAIAAGLFSCQLLLS